MRYVMKQKFWTMGKDFAIKDEDGIDRFYVDGRAFSIGSKLSFQDMQGNELVFIKQKLFSWGPTYELQRAGEASAVVKKKIFTFFNSRFTIDATGDGLTPDDLEVKGDFWSHEYEFSRVSGDMVATVSKKWFSWTDTYGVDIIDGEDDVLVLACAVVIDLCSEHRRSASADFGST